MGTEWESVLCGVFVTITLAEKAESWLILSFAVCSLFKPGSCLLSLYEQDQWFEFARLSRYLLCFAFAQPKAWAEDLPFGAGCCG
ncbi:hypothetical protein EJ08DRAFT_224529 [Tothia fuscella]|uniref:Uncharacterized protein n=1 Tax=Tothia fuscella TaxID=1048955 RepID=A0A9P4P2I4_9PEZI|nr:hypothetical protein EJ08DRAFT_224529 [Tothia fuscella]